MASAAESGGNCSHRIAPIAQDCKSRACVFHPAERCFRAPGIRPKTRRPEADAAEHSKGWFRIAPRGKNTGTPLPGIVARRDMSTNRMEVLRAMVAQNPADAFARYGLAMEFIKGGDLAQRGCASSAHCWNTIPITLPRTFTAARRSRNWATWKRRAHFTKRASKLPGARAINMPEASCKPRWICCQFSHVADLAC